MGKTYLRLLGMVLCAIVLTVGLVACGSPAASVSGKYHTDNLGLTFSDFEFTGTNQVTLFCGGFENAHGTYKTEGAHYIVEISSHDNDSYYYGQVEEIKNDCDVIVTPKNENTISVEIKAKDSGYVYAGQLGAKEYTKQ
ncbi:MAG: hypothetical protein IJ087_06975 [Eggerthellaceae bacterium]|nr:hypothetical protein [Eggerthellaceae bacterium]